MRFKCIVFSNTYENVDARYIYSEKEGTGEKELAYENCSIEA